MVVQEAGYMDTYYHAHGILTYVKSSIENAFLLSVTNINSIHEVTIKIDKATISTTYTNPPHVLVKLGHPDVNVGDFNCHHLQWKRKANDKNGEALRQMARRNQHFSCV